MNNDDALKKYYNGVIRIFILVQIVSFTATILLKKLGILFNYLPTFTFSIGIVFATIGVLKKIPESFIMIILLTSIYLTIASLVYQTPLSISSFSILGLCITALFLMKWLVLVYGSINLCILWYIQHISHFMPINDFVVQMNCIFFATICLFVLTRWVRKLIDQLKDSHLQLEKVNASLEEIVMARTQALCLTNEELKNEIIVRKIMEEKTRYLAEHDCLTDLPNRRLFNRLLEEKIQHLSAQNYLSVYMIDLDAFKDINDRLGHDQGDELLKQVANRFNQLVTSSIIAGRIGGDEFILMAADLTTKEMAYQLAEKILHSFKIPFLLNKQELCITISMGVSIYHEDSFDISTLFKHADIALYRAKEDGKNRFKSYNEIEDKKMLI